MDFSKLFEELNRELRDREESGVEDKEVSKSGLLAGEAEQKVAEPKEEDAEEPLKLPDAPKPFDPFNDDPVGPEDEETKEPEKEPEKEPAVKQKLLTKDDLTDDQKSALEYINAFMESECRQMVLCGPAGTGKTSLVNVLLDELDKKNVKYVCTAPTNKAVEVIAKRTNRQFDRTIFSLCGLKLVDLDDKEPYLERDGESKLGDYDIVVIDEASMTGTELLRNIEGDLVEFSYIKVLYVGDPCQIPAVEDSNRGLLQSQCKNTVQRRYGVDNPFQSEMCKAKSRMTNLSKIGVEYPGQSIICRNKGIDTYFHRTGYRHNMLNPDSKNKVFETTIEHFGAIGFASKKIKKKQVDTLKARYGVETYSQTSEFAKKYIETVTKRFGCSHPCKTLEVQQKIKQTNLSKYGFENCMQNLFVRHRSISNKHRGKYKYEGEIFDSTWEIAYYIWLSDNKIEFKYHPDVDITYEYNGHMCIYKPDFIVNGELHEIKGNHFFSNKQITGELVCPYNAMMNGKMSAKYKCMKKHNVKILLHDDVKPYITYVKNTYGKTYLSQFKCK